MEIGVNRLEVERNTFIITDNIVRLYYIIYAIYQKRTIYVCSQTLPVWAGRERG